jgi:hypothetical protein
LMEELVKATVVHPEEESQIAIAEETEAILAVTEEGEIVENDATESKDGFSES